MKTVSNLITLIVCIAIMVFSVSCTKDETDETDDILIENVSGEDRLEGDPTAGDASEDEESEESTSEDSAAEEDTSEDSTSEEDASEDSASEEDTSEDSTSEEDASEDSPSEEDTSEESSSEDSESEDETSEDEASEGDTSEDSSSEDSESDEETSEAPELKADFEFVEGEMICPSTPSYQIGWKATVKNLGEAAGRITVQAWLSNDQTIGGDTAAGGLVFGNASAGETLTRTFGATVSNVSDYAYLLLQIDHENLIDEIDETNNILVIPIPDRYTESCSPEVFEPDFEFESGEIICPPHSNYQIGWKVDVRNTGNVTANVTVQAWLSNDQMLGDDAAAGGLALGKIEDDGSRVESFGATVDNVGDYEYLLLQLDHNELVNEKDETNNLIAIKIPANYPYAMCEPEDFDAITCGDISFNEGLLSVNDIIASNASGNILEVGDVIIYRTNKNRCGKLQILNIDDAENKNLTIKATTFNNDGSVYSETNSLQIRGTFSCDLDTMVEPASGTLSLERDFWWERENTSTTNLNPQNGAKFHKYEF